MVKPEPIEGFHALKFKEEMQLRVQAALSGLSGEQKFRKIREMVENGPFAEWWKRMQEAQAAKSA